MIRSVGRLIGAIVQFLLVFTLLVLISIVVTIGLIAGIGQSDIVTDPVIDVPDSIETPDPLPDIPLDRWFNPNGTDSDTPQPGMDDHVEHVEGDPVVNDPGPTTVETADGQVVSSDIERQVHEQVNEIRVDADQSSLEYDEEITSIARIHSNDMATREYFAHQSPEGEGPSDRMEPVFPGQCYAIGENLALVNTAGATDATEIATRIVDGWMNSPGHRENLLADRWHSQGIGVVVSDDGRVYATQKFCA